MTPRELATRMMALEATWIGREAPVGVDVLRRERLAIEAAVGAGDIARLADAHRGAERVARALALFWGVPLVPPEDAGAPGPLARAMETG